MITAVSSACRPCHYYLRHERTHSRRAAKDWDGVFDINTEHIVKAVIGQDEKANGQKEAPIELSDREIEVLRLILEGNSSKEVAEILCCSKRTVDFYLGKVYGKLDVSNRLQAMRRINLLGLMSLVEGERTP